MASDKKNAANRENGKKSTGPRTREGKQRTSRNALTIKIYAGPQLLPGESKEEYDALVASLAKALIPVGPIEWMYVSQAAGGIMRLKRVDFAEHSYISGQVIRLAQKYGDDRSERIRSIALGNVLSALANQPFDGFEDKINRQRKKILADIKEALEALREEQQRRFSDERHRLTDGFAQKLDGPRLLAAPTDIVRELPHKRALLEHSAATPLAEKQSQKTTEIQRVDFSDRPQKGALAACLEFIRRLITSERT